MPTMLNMALLSVSPYLMIAWRLKILAYFRSASRLKTSKKGISKLRNRVIARVFQELGMIEHWGSGIQRMTAACHDRGLDTPKFEEIGTHFRVTLSAVRRHAPAKYERDQSILGALAAGSERGLSTSQIAKR